MGDQAVHESSLLGGKEAMVASIAEEETWSGSSSVWEIRC